MLLEQSLKFFDHEIVDRAPLDEIANEALDRVTFVNDDSLKAEIRNVNIDVELGLTLVLTLHVILEVSDLTLIQLKLSCRGSGLFLSSGRVGLLLNRFLLYWCYFRLANILRGLHVLALVH